MCLSRPRCKYPLYFQVTLMKHGTINKFCEAHLCHGRLISFYRANKPCSSSSQTEEQRMTRRSQEWLHLPACSYTHLTEQKCLVKSTLAHWVVHTAASTDPSGNVISWVMYLEAAIFIVCIFFFANYYSNTLMESGTSFISCLTELNFGKHSTDPR